MTTIESEFVSLRTRATERIDEVHHALNELALQHGIDNPGLYGTPIMIDQTPQERGQDFHLRIGIASVAAKLSLKRTSVVIPLETNSLELTPKNRIITYDSTVMRIGGESMRNAQILTGRPAVDRVWEHIGNATDEDLFEQYVRKGLYEVPTLIDKSLEELKQKNLIPLL